MQDLIKEITKRKSEFLKFLLRFFISLVFGIIIVFLIKFYLFSQNIISSEDIKKYLPIIRKFIEPYLPFFEKSKINQILFIFFNNLRVVIVAGILSFITFGIFAEIVAYVNGFIVGALISSISIIIPEISGIKIFIFGILPHGVFEIFAFLISLTFAHSLSFTKQGIKEINIYLRSYIIVIPILFLASIIEVLITPLLLGLNLTI
ncbi:MAG: stage II sporulation protein M [Caldisericia bacterium]